MRKMILLFLFHMLLISAAHADVYSELSPGLVSVVAPESIPLRKETTIRAEPFHFIGPGVVLTLLSSDSASGWAYVRLVSSGEEITGYVRSGALMNGDYLYWDMCRMIASGENGTVPLYSEPHAGSQILAQYHTGVLAENYHQEENGFLRVRIGTNTGFAEKRFLVPWNAAEVSAIPAAALQSREGAGAYLRSEPSAESEPLGFYSNGTQAAVLGIAPDGWRHVMIQGATGFLKTDELADPSPH